MNVCSVSFTIYPLSQRPINGIIEDALHDFRSSDVEVSVGPMKIAIFGEETEVFNAMRSGLRAASERGDALLVATGSSACSTKGPRSHRLLR